eukprot:290639_1
MVTTILILALLQNAFSQFILINNASCDEILSYPFIGNETHYYRFIINQSYNVNFKNCDSNSDIILTIYDTKWNDISDLYCKWGDNCGTCPNSAYLSENFMIPNITAGVYYIELIPRIPGSYELEINCFTTNSDENSGSKNNTSYTNSSSLTPNSTLIYTTFPTVVFLTETKCGDRLNGELFSSHDIDYIQFNLSSDADLVLLDATGSLYYTHLYVYDEHFNLVEQSDATKLAIVSLQAAEYVIAMSGYNDGFIRDYGQWELHIICRHGNKLVGIQNEIGCDEQINSSFMFASDNAYVYVNLSDNIFSITLDSCDSSYDTRLLLFDLDYNYISNTDRDKCLLYSTNSGEFLVVISGTLGSNYQQDWGLRSSCVNLELDMYVVVPAPLGITWSDAEIFCEDVFGTSLATVITDEDLIHATNTITEIFQAPITNYQQESFEQANTTVWIGMYRDMIYGSKWQWISGITCEYTSSGDCVDDIHWHKTGADTTFISDIPHIGAGLLIATPDNSTPTIYSNLISLTNFLYLCDAPNGKYSVDNCSGALNCWKDMNCCHNPKLENTTGHLFESKLGRIPIASWNSTLYIVADNAIYYTAIQLLDIQYEWNYIVFDNSLLKSSKLQYYAQWESNLYVFAFRWQNELNDTLMHINLHTLDTEFQILPVVYSEYFLNTEWGFYESTFCMVSDQSHLHIVAPGLILIHTFADNAWTTKDIDKINIISCAESNNHRFIYIFGANEVIYEKTHVIIKYNIQLQTSEYLQTTNICEFQYEDVKSVTAPNDKIYINGCYSASWKTVIFNTFEDGFITESIDIDTPNTKNIPYYRSSQLSVFDDNVLLMLHTTNAELPLYYTYNPFKHISLYFAVTNIASINFIQTIPSEARWPSDGFDIKYYVNTFITGRDQIYNISFWTGDTIRNITAFISLNTSKDNCICLENSYKCRHCKQHLDLELYLTLEDNQIFELTFVPSYHTSKNETIPLLLPKKIMIPLQRCVISFLQFDQSTSNNEGIKFDFGLSENCYSKVGTNFSLNITALSINISKTLIINIINYRDKLCKICDIYTNKCATSNHSSFLIYHNISSTNEKVFYIILESNMIDFGINASKNNKFKYHPPDHKIIDRWDRRLLYLVFLLIIPMIIILYLLIYYTKKYSNAFVIDKALVGIIGISQFDDKTKHLPGVRRNVDCLYELWKNKYNYDVYVCNNDTLYSTKNDVIEFIDNLVSKLASKKYKCALIHVISHGGDLSFTTSDGKFVLNEFIRHEIVEMATVNKHKQLIKFLVHHGCRGSGNYHIGNTFATMDNTVEPEDWTNRSCCDCVTRIVPNTDDNNKYDDLLYDANCVTIYGNISGRSMTDSGIFTDCIYNAFANNLSTAIKASFRSVIGEIKRNLPRKTKQAEICNINETLQYDYIRFERSKESVQKEVNIELQSLQTAIVNRNTDLTYRRNDTDNKEEENDSFQHEDSEINNLLDIVDTIDMN